MSAVEIRDVQLTDNDARGDAKRAGAKAEFQAAQTRAEIGGENGSTVIFPMPIDIVKPFLDIAAKNALSTNGNKIAALP